MSLVATDRAVSARYSAFAIAAIPLTFLALGIVLRYAAFEHLHPQARVSDYVQAMCRWDCGWYLRLAEHGYEGFPTPDGRNVGSWAFFPLYPLLVRATAWALNWPTLTAAILVSMCCSYAACLVAWSLLERNIRAYVLYSAFVLSGPFSFHYAMPLTEPLTLLLLSVVLLALQKSHFLAAGAATALLSATRLIGVFVVIVTIFKMYGDYRDRGGAPRLFPLHLAKSPLLLLALVISPLGLFAFMAYLDALIGDGLAFGHVQRAFGRVLHNPLLYFWDNLTAMPKEGWLPMPHQWGAMAVMVGVALSTVLAVRRQYGPALFCLIGILLPLSSGIGSMIRYVSALVPLTALMATLLAAHRITFLVALLGLLVSCYIVTMAWFGGHLALV